MNHPLRENLEIASADGAEWVRCKPCHHKYCRDRSGLAPVRQNSFASADGGRPVDECLERRLFTASTLLPVLRCLIGYRFRRGEIPWLRKDRTGLYRKR